MFLARAEVLFKLKKKKTHYYDIMLFKVYLKNPTEYTNIYQHTNFIY